MKGKALRRALETSDAVRIGADLPLITDTTELVTPQRAQELLAKNRANRPVNWKRVEQYSAIMTAGEWKLHSQGIILDAAGNLLTGQNRLWSVVYSGCSVYMRVSRGNPPEVARILDRGQPQSARDLASRQSERKHSPAEAAIARAVCAMRGTLRPSTDVLADVLAEKALLMSACLAAVKGQPKTRALLMIIAATCETVGCESDVADRMVAASSLADRLDRELSPETAASCWGKGAAFRLALECARKCVREGQS